MTDYQPELGQMIFGNPTGDYDCPDYVITLLEGLLGEIERVYWNRGQEAWERFHDPKIPGITFRPYYWGDDETEASLPNFVVEGVNAEIRWYKHPHRGVSATVNWDPDQWVVWFDVAMKLITEHEDEQERIERKVEG